MLNAIGRQRFTLRSTRGSLVLAAVLTLLGAVADVSPIASAANENDADLIRSKTGDVRGLIVHVGCGSGELTTALRHREDVRVQGLDTDPDMVRATRIRLRSLGVYGPVSIHRYDGRQLPYADRLVNLLLVEKAPASLTRAEMHRVLSPGGWLCILRSGTWQATRKPWPDSLDQWTHFLHGPDGNAVARDEQVGNPRSLQWIDGPRFLRHHNMTASFSAMVSAKGRLFSIVDGSVPGVTGLPDQWELVARDAFNGLVSWRRRLPNWGWSAWTAGQQATSRSRFDAPQDLPRRLVAVGDRVFVASGETQPVQMLDAASGKTLLRYADTEHASEILYQQGKLIVAMRRTSEKLSETVDQRGNRASIIEQQVTVFDAATARPIWSKKGLAGVAAKTGPLRSFTQLYLTCSEDRLFLVDGEQIVAIDLANGTELWRAERPERKDTEAKYGSLITSNLCTLVADGDHVYFCQLKALTRNPWYEPTQSRLVALSASSGQKLWEHLGGSWNCYSPPDLFVIDKLVWSQTATRPYRLVGLDRKTGKVIRSIDIEDAVIQEHHHRCYRNKATERYVLHGRRGIELLNLDDSDKGNELNHWTRGACRYGIMPSNGLIYAPPDPCICYITAKLAGMVALGPETSAPERTPDDRRLERGPAFGMSGGANAHPASDWDTYRGDARRSGSSRVGLPAALSLAWRTRIGARLSAPTIAAGRLFVASIDTHTVHAMDVRTGRKLWSYTCDGPVDSPPTLFGPLVLFGASDGCVYALRSTDGALVWRFQAAPARRWITAFGNIESAWPVHGSPLVHDGLLYVAAGRTSFLDHGITVYALDPWSGTVIQRRELDSDMSARETPPYDRRLRYDMPPDRSGALTDVLVAEGDSIFMRHTRFDPRDLGRNLEREKSQSQLDDVYRHQIPRVYSPGPQLAASVGLLEENWYNQLYWSFAQSSQSRLLVFDDQRTYGVRAFGGKPARHARSIFKVGASKYTLFADIRRPKLQRAWSVPIAQRVSALLVAPDALFVAGSEGGISPDDPWKSVEYRGPGHMTVHDPATGKQLATYRLPAVPVWNGLAASDRHLFGVLRDGSIVCYRSSEHEASNRTPH